MENRDSKNKMSIFDARKEIKGSRAIFIITDENDMVNIMGYIDYVSKDRTTYGLMIDRFHQLGDDGIEAMLIGSYENGGGVDVEYIL